MKATSRRAVGLVLACWACSLLLFTGCQKEPEEKRDGDIAYEHVVQLDKIGSRALNTEGHEKAKQYIVDAMTESGYAVEQIPFSIQVSGGATRDVTDATDDDAPDESLEDIASSSTISGVNLQAYLPGESDEIVLLGAHYDSWDGDNTGADDNATGIGVLLELAGRLMESSQTKKLPCGIQFVFFDAEERGMAGSAMYAVNMDSGIRARIRCMINVDSVGAGDYLYAYGGAGPTGWVRELALGFASQLDIPLRTTDGSNPQYPAGTTGEWSDHAAFAHEGIDFVYLEGTNWDVGNKDGYTQTETQGQIMHSEKDTLAFIEEHFPDRMRIRLNFACRLTEALCRGIKPI